MNIVNTIAAYFFFLENQDDPNIEISKEEVEYQHQMADLFVNASNALINDLSQLQNNAEELEIQTVFYDVGKAYYGEDKKELLAFFRKIYAILFERFEGPRLGKFVILFGLDNFIERFQTRLNNPFELRF